MVGRERLYSVSLKTALYRLNTVQLLEQDNNQVKAKDGLAFFAGRGIPSTACAGWSFWI
jgi:hypothetical protein